MQDFYGDIGAAADFVAARVHTSGAVGVVLGSGLGAFAEQLSDSTRISYGDIPGMPASTVPGHAGSLRVGHLGEARVVCLEGRVHLYEGHPIERVVFGARLLARLGCEVVIVTNAAGGIRDTFVPGDLMLITDHINLTGHNPLIGAGVGNAARFVDMTRAYDVDLAELARRAAGGLGIPLREGVYAALLGPSYETPAEIRMLRTLGADAVGMSTASEVIALRQLGVRIGAMSCITNAAAGISAAVLDHEDVQRVAAESRGRFVALLSQWIRDIHGSHSG
jgi:purine-nucleoside phosphorylase